MKNNITLVGINFYPEESSSGLYSTQMAEHLAKDNTVEVVTGFPYYPEWAIRETYRKKPRYLVEQHGAITLYRYKQYVPGNPTFRNRIIHLLDFTLGSVRNIFKIKKSDLVICVVPFTSSIVPGWLLAKRRGAKLWVHIQDFEFDAAIESGLAGKQGVVKTKVFQALFWLERKLFNQADLVSTISYGMLARLEEKTDTPGYFFPNWVDENFINPQQAKTHPLMRSEKFKVLYSGNIGAKQDWEFFIKVAAYFKDDEKITFIVVGAGARKAWLVEQTRSFSNVRHFTPVEYATLPDLLCSADLHILFQKNEVIDTVMPSKLLGMMASAVPSVVTGSPASEVAKVFEASKGGYFYDSGCDSGCLDNVLKIIQYLSAHKTAAQAMGLRARSYIIEHFSASRVLGDFEDKVRELIHS